MMISKKVPNDTGDDSETWRFEEVTLGQHIWAAIIMFCILASLSMLIYTYWPYELFDSHKIDMLMERIEKCSRNNPKVSQPPADNLYN